MSLFIICVLFMFIYVVYPAPPGEEMGKGGIKGRSTTSIFYSMYYNVLFSMFILRRQREGWGEGWNNTTFGSRIIRINKINKINRINKTNRIRKINRLMK